VIGYLFDHLKGPPFPLPLPVPLEIPLALGIPLPLPDVPRPIRDAGAGVEYFEDTLDDVGGFSTNDVSVVLNKC
jgi:hypothetical protein